MTFIPVGTVQKYFLLLFFIMSSLVSFSQKSTRKLVWADEFNYQGLPDSTKWDYDKARGCPSNCRWGNNELQYYTWNRKENARVENGHLIIEARKEQREDAKYTSTRLVTRNKGDWKYGRIEVRAKLPKGKGMWPAIWMLPTDWKYGGWPHSGEIDIMENVGYMPDSLFGTVHTGAYNGMIGTQKVKGIYVNDLSTNFHVYAIEWNEKSISFYVDDKLYNVFHNDNKGSASWPFDQRFHLLINLAVGGDWGGRFGIDDSAFPQQLLVDFVRVYQ